MVREITAILVSWNDEEDLIGAISSLARARDEVSPEGPGVSLVVVDNGGSLDRCRILSLWSGATVLVNESNRGFGPAANQGAEAAAGEILLFLNPDTRAEGDPFTELARAFSAHPDAAAVAPILLDWDFAAGSPSKIHNPKSKIPRPLSPPDREDQFTFQFRHLPDFANDARELLLLDHIAPNSRPRRRFRYADADREKPFAVEQPAAAALAIRAEVFRRLGAFDSRFTPAWFEDVDLAARLRREGPVLAWPAARFRHRGGVASDSLGYARFLPAYYRNALLYRRLHYSIAARLLYRPLLAAGMLLRLAALPFRRSLPRPRAESARAYLATVAVALGFSNPKSKI